MENHLICRSNGYILKPKISENIIHNIYHGFNTLMSQRKILYGFVYIHCMFGNRRKLSEEEKEMRGAKPIFHESPTDD